MLALAEIDLGAKLDILVTCEAAWVLSGKPVYFIEKGLEQFLINAASKVSLLDLDLPDQALCLSTHPDLKMDPVLVVKTKDMCVVNMSRDGGVRTGFLPLDSVEFPEASAEVQLAIKLAFGFFIYSYAHPDKVTAGFPAEMKERCERLLIRSGHKGHVLEATPKIRSSPGVHWRNGFWRMYRSDRYVKMKGKVQWVDGTEVSGHGRTVT